jgi:hypothetical protein
MQASRIVGHASAPSAVREPPAAPLVEVLGALTGWSEAARVPYVVVGGIAASLLGRPRLTQDVDALAIAAEADWARALSQAAAFGLVARGSDPLAFARRTRVLLLRHEPTGIDLDVIFAGMPFEAEAVTNGTEVDVSGVRLRLPRVEDLLIMKAIAHRPKDLQDIQGLLAANPSVDASGAIEVVRQFAAAAAMPELATDFERLVHGR